MIKRSTLIIVAFFFFMLVLLWFVQRTKETDSSQITPTIETMYLHNSISPDEVIQVKIENQNGKRVSFMKINDLWAMTEPREDIKDKEMVATIVQQFINIRVLTSLDTLPDMSAIGLNPAQYQIILTLNNHKIETIKIGNLTSIGNGYYAQAENNKILVLDKYSVENLLELFENPPIKETITPLFSETITETTETENTNVDITETP